MKCSVNAFDQEAGRSHHSLTSGQLGRNWLSHHPSVRVVIKTGELNQSEILKLDNEYTIICFAIRHSTTRILKGFAEPNRPDDWFSQKNCALQYEEMLEKVEQPKRKRGERGEETAQDVIVRELTQKRIEECRKLIEEGEKNLRRWKTEMQVFESTADPPAEFLKMLVQRKRTEEAEAAAAIIRHQQWLDERKAKIAAAKIATRQTLLRPSRSQALAAAVPPAVIIVKPEETLPVSAAVTVETQDDTSGLSASDSTGPTTPVSQNPPLPSPLLTHLLQSPSSSTTPYKDVRQPETVSPSKGGPVFFSNQPQQAASSARQPVSSSQSVVTGSSSPVKGGSGDEASQSSQAPSASPTLSKLLELPLSSASANKLPPLPDSGKNQDHDVIDLSDEVPVESENAETTDNQRNDAGDCRSPVKTEPKDSEKNEDVKANKNQEEEIKTPLTRRQRELRGRPTPIQAGPAAAPAAASAASVTTAQTPQPATPVVTAPATPAGTVVTGSASVATRRSGRIRGIRDVSESESTDKKPVIEDPNLIDASASEESLDAVPRPAVSSKAPSISDSIPNSPASTMHSEDTDADRDKKRWQKSVLSVVKFATTHRYAHVFLHPAHKEVGDDYLDVVKRPVDLTSIRKRVENQSGEYAIRTTAEFQREMLLLFQNALMYNKPGHDVYEMAADMQKEVGDEIEALIRSEKELAAYGQQPSTSGGKTGSSETPAAAKQRIRSDRRTPASAQTQDDASSRRRSRTSTDTDPGTPGTSVPLTRTALKKKANA